MHHFTPIQSLIGGALFGLSASLLLLLNGRVAGISGIFSGLLLPARGEFAWRAMFIGGLMCGGLLVARQRPELFNNSLPRSSIALVSAGILVGFGARLANGCTSGHSLCGVSRLSTRSIAATMMFVARIRELLRVPSVVSPGVLRVDPVWAPLRDDPRFRKLAELDQT